MKCYKYDSLTKSYTWLGIAGGAILAIAGILLIAVAFYVQVVREQQFIPTLTIFSLGFATFSLVQFSLMANLKPDICLDSNQLYIRFFFTQKSARLEDIVAVKRVVIPSRTQSFVILFQKGLTPFHRLYGWIYGYSFCPGIYVGGSISDKDELERVLNRYI